MTRTVLDSARPTACAGVAATTPILLVRILPHLPAVRVLRYRVALTMAGHPAPAGTVCGKSVGCTAPPAAASNDCCAIEAPGGGGYSATRECFYVDPQTCSGPAFGGVSSTGVCMPDGSCQPQP